MRVLLPLLLRHPRSIMLRQASPNRPRLLRAQVQGQIFIILVEDTQLRALIGIYNGENASDGFAEVVAIGGDKY